MWQRWRAHVGSYFHMTDYKFKSFWHSNCLWCHSLRNSKYTCLQNLFTRFDYRCTRILCHTTGKKRSTENQQKNPLSNNILIFISVWNSWSTKRNRRNVKIAIIFLSFHILYIKSSRIHNSLFSWLYDQGLRGLRNWDFEKVTFFYTKPSYHMSGCQIFRLFKIIHLEWSRLNARVPGNALFMITHCQKIKLQAMSILLWVEEKIVITALFIFG